MKVMVLGSGSWGTALTILLARNGHEVVLVGRSSQELQQMRSDHTNGRYLPGYEIPSAVRFLNFDQELDAAELTVMAVPSSAVREIASGLKRKRSVVVVASKGLETSTGKTMCEVVREELPESEVGVLSGPNLAIEIARGIPTVAIAAFGSEAAGNTTRDAFSSASFRVSASLDVVGVELAGALKNVLAIGAGMSDGLGFGDNTKGAFLSRGLMEMARLGVHRGAKLETFLGPAGVGDLFATAVSRLSRNYRLGRALGEGRSLEQALAELGQVAEGVPTSAAAVLLASSCGVEMPVFAAVQAVLQGRLQPLQAVAKLMERTSSMGDFF